MIDANGFRSNVGIILANNQKQVWWGKRVGQDSWQFPQGGLNNNEDIEQCLFRELQEETGLSSKDVTILGSTRNWLRYKLPHRFIRDSKPTCIGQKQKWFLLRLDTTDDNICFSHSVKPEFDGWKWVSYWFPLQQVIDFKRDVYRNALRELAPMFFDVTLRAGRVKPLNDILS